MAARCDSALAQKALEEHSPFIERQAWRIYNDIEGYCRVLAYGYDDVLADLHLGLLRAIETADPARPLEPLLMTVFANIKIDLIRKAKSRMKIRTQSIHGDEVTWDPPSIETRFQQVDDRDTLAVMREIVGHFGAEARAVMESYLDGNSIEEIARQRGTTVRTIEHHFYSMRARIKLILEARRSL